MTTRVFGGGGSEWRGTVVLPAVLGSPRIGVRLQYVAWVRGREKNNEFGFVDSKRE